MKKFLYMAVAAIAALSSCSSDDIVNGNENGNGNAPVFTATIEGEATSRTTIVNGSEDDKMMVNWSNGDQISINGSLYSTTSTTNTADFTLVDGQTAAVAVDGKYKAVYPASLYDAGTYTLPASYTHSITQFNMPMYAESENTTLAFKNLCGVLAINVPGSEISKISTITVSSNKQMNGAFTATADGVLTFADKTLTDDDKMITLSRNISIASGKVATVYLPVPAGTYGHLRITISGPSDRKAMTTKAASITIERNKIYPIDFADNRELTDHIKLIQQWFSVSPIKEVQFTMGNLYMEQTASSKHWAFETNQYDRPTTWSTSHVGHLYWTKSLASSYTKTYSSAIKTATDDVPYFAESKGINVGGLIDLYALSKAEWKYLVSTRTNASKLYKGNVTVADIAPCLIIAPDGYDYTNHPLQTSYTAEAWAEAEALGLVCLPPTSRRSSATINSSDTSTGYYWTSTPNGSDAEKAEYFKFTTEKVTTGNGPRYQGFAIRLVK